MRTRPAARLGSLHVFLLIGQVVLAGRALAIPLIEAVVTASDSSTGSVEIYITTPDEGLRGFAFSVAYTGALTLSSGACFEVPDAVGCNDNVVDHPGESPAFYGSIFSLAQPGVGPDFFPPFGVGGERFLVGELIFDLNGGGGLVTPGTFHTGVDGFATADWDITQNADFSGANLGLFSFQSAALVPEPSLGLLFGVGFAALAARRPLGDRTHRSLRSHRPH